MANSRLPLLLLLLLLIGTPLGSAAFEALQLARCPPRGSLTLTVPEDLPVGSALLSWDPAKLALKSGRDEYKQLVSRALSQYSVSPFARAFFSDGIEDTFSVTPGASRAVLTRPLPAGGPDLLRGRFSIGCASATSKAATQFSLNIRLQRRPLRMVLEPPRPAVSRWSPTGTVLANISVFAAGRRVPLAACTVVGAPSGAALTVDAASGRVILTAPLQPPAADAVEWTSVAVACEWDGRRLRAPLPVAPYQLWRRPRTRLNITADSAALTGSQLGLDLGALLVRRGPRVRLSGDGRGASGAGRARLGPRRLLLDLPAPGRSLTVNLEATDAQGHTEVARLHVTVLGADVADASGCAGSLYEPLGRRWPRWWPVLLLAAAAALLVFLAAGAWCGLRRNRLRASPVVKPQFV